MRGKTAMMPSVIPVVWLVMYFALPATPADKGAHGISLVGFPSLVRILLLIQGLEDEHIGCWSSADGKRERDSQIRDKCGRLGLGTRHSHLSKLSTLHRSPSVHQLQILTEIAANLFDIAQPITSGSMPRLIRNDLLKIAERQNHHVSESVTARGATCKVK